jgi:hypothetical protein
VVGYVQPVVEATGTDECRVVDVVGDVEAVDGEAVSDKIDSCASSINGVNPEAPLVVVDLNEHRKECVVENVQTVVLAAGTQLIDSCHSRVGEFNSTAIVVTVELPLDVNECQTRDVPESVQSIPESVRNSISNSCSSARDVGSSQTTVGAVVVEVDSMTVNVNECETNDSDHGPHLHVPLTGDNMEKPSQLSSDQDDVFADAELEIDVVDRAAAAAELQEPCDFSDDNGNIESDDATDADMMTGRKRSRTGQRKYDKLLACFFCHKLLKMKMKRHLISVHRDEPEVTEILQITDEKEKALEFSRLVKRGNFLHNASVLSGEPGELIVGRQVQTKHDPAKYLPCVHCQTLLLQHDLYRHVKKCSLKPLSSAAGSGQATSLKSKRHTVSESRMFLFGAVNSDDVPSSDKFRKEILGSLHHDNIAKVIKKDDLIIRLGMSMHERHGKNRVHDICQQMRQLGRLLIEVNALQLQKNAPKMTLSQCITGSNFDTVVQATRNLCTQIDDPSGRPLFKSPSIGLKLGHHLVRCAEIKKGMAIRADCIVTDREAESFLALHKAEWTGRVSSASLATLKSRRYNCPDELPLTADLTKLKMYQDQQLAVLTKQLAIEKSNYSLWKTLMEVTYSRLVIFNKRRCGETAKLTVAAFQNRPRWEDCASDQLTASLKPVERKLLSRSVAPLAIKISINRP